MMRYLLCILAILCLSSCAKPQKCITEEDVYRAIYNYHIQVQKALLEAKEKQDEENTRLDQEGSART